METFAGCLASILILTIFVKSSYHVAGGTEVYGMPLWKVALIIHLISWTVQFIGHGVFEGMYYMNLMIFIISLFSFVFHPNKSYFSAKNRVEFSLNFVYMTCSTYLHVHVNEW